MKISATIFIAIALHKHKFRSMTRARFSFALFSVLYMSIALAAPSLGAIIQGGSTVGLAVFDFDSVPNPSSPWTPYSLISGPGLLIGERLAGQSTTPNGNHEIVSGTPGVTLQIDVSRPVTTGVSVFSGVSYPGDQDFGPEGALGWPNPNSLGEGSFTMLFSQDQAIMGFDVAYSSLASQVQLLFYGRTGALLGSLTGAHPATGTGSFPLVFSVSSGPLIAAVTVNNTDTDGLGYDNIRYAVPEPGIPALVGLGIAALTFARRSKRVRCNAFLDQ